jgi:hypothetical protein
MKEEGGVRGGSPCGRRRTKNYCVGEGNLSVYATAFSGLEEGAFDLERFRGDGRQLRIYGTHEGLATHI